MMMQIIADRGIFGYFSNQNYCILQYITDSIRLIPLCILLLRYLVCPEKSFFENTTLGVSHYETHRPCLCRRPRSHWRYCHLTNLLCFGEEQGQRSQSQHASRSDVPA